MSSRSDFSGQSAAEGTSGARSVGASDVKRVVRERYGAAAAGACGCGGGQAAKPSAPGDDSVRHLDLRHLDLGCGNPLAFAGIRAGDTVLDLGSGSGEEVLRAARMTGPGGKAIGVDMTDGMLELARRNLAASGLDNVEFLKGEIEVLPLPDGSVDVIVSNCVLNLSPDKSSAFAEAFRVLRPGGRFVVADVVIPGDMEPDAEWRRDVEAWSACEAGAMSEAAFVKGLRQAGFIDVALERIATYATGRVEDTGDGLAGLAPLGGGCCSPVPEGVAAGCCGGASAVAGGAVPAAHEVELASDLIRARKPEA